jgi:hypothetical protein
MSSKPSFEDCKTALLRLAQVTAKAKTVAELRALLLADSGAPYHSYDVLVIGCELINLADRLQELIWEDLDEAGAPL